MLQDVPFAVVNTLFLLRVVNDPVSVPNSSSSSGLCAKRLDPTTVTVLLLALFTSIASLTYKAMKVLKFPEVWREHQRLLRDKVELTERARRLNEQAAAAAAHVVEPDSSDSDRDLQGGR